MIGAFGFLSEYNLLESIYSLEKIFGDTKKENYPFLAIADSNNLYASYKVFKNAQRPYIIGMKLDIVHLEDECSILCYAMSSKGYENLVILSSMVQLNENKRLEFDEVVKYQRGLYFISSGFESDIDSLIFQQNLDEAEIRLKDYQEKLEYFSLGLNLQSLTQEIKIAPLLKEFADANDILLLPVNYMAYKKEEQDAYDVFIQIKSLNKKRFDQMDLSFLTLKQLKLRYQDYLEVFINLKKIIPLFTFKYQKPKFLLPSLPKSKNSQLFLKELCYKGLTKILKTNKNLNKNDYVKRLEYELGVINSMGFNDYFLIVWDFVKYAKENKILVGPGRGSAAGSLVSYLLNITEVDPLKYQLLFERFLNKDRYSMPDIDLDFPDNKREQVIEYVKDKYGSNHVISINTFSRFAAKSAIRDVCRIKGYSPTETNQIVKRLSVIKAPKEPYLVEILSLAKVFDGLPRQTGTHAAGIVLAKEDLRYVVPLQMGPKIYQAQYEHEDLTDMGLLKIDFLGIRNLSIIADVLDIINQEKDKLNLKSIPFNDKKTYDLLSSGDTLGVFQLESVGMRNVLKKLKPNNFNDLIALLALYRPGPMDNIDLYIKRRNKEPFTYIDNSLKPILSETYGIIVYQEQIMMIAQKFASYTLNEADLLRVGISKKDANILQNERKKFITRSIKSGHDEKLAEKIYDYIVKFADYGFNKSHSVAYSVVAYQMAYLKANYYPIFMAVLLSKMGSDSNISIHIGNVRKRGIKVFSPDINTSTDVFEVTKQGLLFPLTGIKNIGSSIYHKIKTERTLNGAFKTFADFKERMKTDINSRILDGLIFSGAFDVFNQTKKSLYDQKDQSISIYQSIVFDLKQEKQTEYDTSFLALKEKEVLGFNLSVSPIEGLDDYCKAHKLVFLKDITIKTGEVKTAGLIRYLNEIKTKQNKQMAFITITDYLTNLEVTIFPKQYEKFKSLLVEKKVYEFSLLLQDYQGGSFILTDLKVIEDIPRI